MLKISIQTNFNVDDFFFGNNFNTTTLGFDYLSNYCPFSITIYATIYLFFKYIWTGRYHSCNLKNYRLCFNLKKYLHFITYYNIFCFLIFK